MVNAAPKETVFSEYELFRLGLIFPPEAESNDPDSVVAKCIGNFEEEMDVKTVTKKCRGTVAKKRTSGTGSGTVKVTLHCPMWFYRKAFGMSNKGLADGVWAYGVNSIHPQFCMTALVKNEDGEIKYKAYPVCSIENGMARKIENGADEVAEIELEVSVSPDDTEEERGMYEALDAELTDEEVKEKWMTAFTPDLVQKKEA